MADIFKQFMNLEETRTATKQLLIKHYKLDTEDVPKRRERSKWTKENKFGFFLGIIKYGQDFLVTELYNLLQQKGFKKKEKAVIDKMYDFHIKVFKQHRGTGSSCRTPSTPPSVSRRNSVEDLDYVPEESEKKLEHVHLKKAVEKRDVVCLFCWENCKLKLQGAHIVAQKEVPFPYDEPCLFERTGLKQKHQVQNGLLLCSGCHIVFDALKRYVDVVDEKLVVKVVNDSNDSNDDKHKEWEEAIEDLYVIRRAREKRWTKIDSRQAVESSGEMALYFVQNNSTKFPNRQALEFHKTACLIWRMAGGGEPDEEYCPDNNDEYTAVDYRFKDIQKWRQDSSAIF